MTNAIAKQLEDASEAQALRIEDQIEANNHMVASIENGYLEAIRILKADFAERNKSLAILAASIRAGTPMLPPAKQLADPPKPFLEHWQAADDSQEKEAA